MSFQTLKINEFKLENTEPEQSGYPEKRDDINVLPKASVILPLI